MERRQARGESHAMANSKLLRGRHSTPGACYVITSVTHRRRPLFRDPHIARCVITEIDKASVECMAWVVMPDHVHWMFVLGDIALGRVVQQMKARSALAVQAATGERGSLWQSGYYEHQLRGSEDLLMQARYIVANPVRAKLVAGLSDYPFWWCRWIQTESDL